MQPWRWEEEEEEGKSSECDFGKSRVSLNATMAVGRRRRREVFGVRAGCENNFDYGGGKSSECNLGKSRDEGGETAARTTTVIMLLVVVVCVQWVPVV
jgi:hypothetical protein